MAEVDDRVARIPIICTDTSAVAGAMIFNPNSWAGPSRGFIQSCWTEYSVLHHCVGEIAAICGDADSHCQNQIQTIQEQWMTRPFDLANVDIYAQQPDLHMRIEALFSGVKTLLDLIVQLLTSERIVTVSVHGFHHAQDVYGGKVLNALRNNVATDRKETAAKAATLISRHKAAWIDQTVVARNGLIHPARGIHQLMFHLEFAEYDSGLVCVSVTPPQIDAVPIDQYAEEVLKNMEELSSEFLALIREAACAA